MFISKGLWPLLYLIIDREATEALKIFGNVVNASCVASAKFSTPLLVWASVEAVCMVLFTDSHLPFIVCSHTA